MKRRLTYYVLTMAILVVAACSSNTKQKKRRGRKGPKPVVATTIPQKTLTTFQTYPASVEGVTNSEVHAKISGYIEEVLVDEGEKVEKGEALFRLETQSLSQKAQSAKANVKAAQVQVDRLKPLVEENIVSKVQLQTAKAKLAQAKSNYQSVVAQIGYSVIKSPVDGFVGRIYLREGSLVGPGSAKPLTVVSDISKVYVYFSLNERAYINFLQRQKGETFQEKVKNMPKVKLVLPNGSLYNHKGIIQTVNSQVDPQTGTVFFRAIFENPKRLLTNGNSATIKIPKVYKNATVVPVPSTIEQQGRKYVLKIVDKKGKKVAKRVSVKTIEEANNMYIVSEGIKKGDVIVAKGINKIRGGTPVKPKVVPFEKIAQPVPQTFR